MIVIVFFLFFLVILSKWKRSNLDAQALKNMKRFSWLQNQAIQVDML